jgi:hypothetical protein
VTFHQFRETTSPDAAPEAVIVKLAVPPGATDTGVCEDGVIVRVIGGGIVTVKLLYTLLALDTPLTVTIT